MLPRPHGVGMCPAVPGAQADQRDKGGVTPLGVLPPALRPEVERLMLRVREERELARIPSRGGASNMDPGAAAAVDPIGDAAADPGDAAVDLASGHDHDKPAGSQLQPGYQDASFPIAGPHPSSSPSPSEDDPSVYNPASLALPPTTADPQPAKTRRENEPSTWLVLLITTAATAGAGGEVVEV